MGGTTWAVGGSSNAQRDGEGGGQRNRIMQPPRGVVWEPGPGLGQSQCMNVRRVSKRQDSTVSPPSYSSACLRAHLALLLAVVFLELRVLGVKKVVQQTEQQGIELGLQEDVTTMG